MSINTMVRLGVERQLEKIELEARAASGGDDDNRTSIASATEKVSAFIPSEVIGIYVAGLGMFSPETYVGKWLIFGVCFLLIPLVIFLDSLLRKRQSQVASTPTQSQSTLNLRTYCLLCIFAILAFVAWSAALPDTPFLAISPYATLIGAWAVIIFAAVMYQAAEVLDIVPKTPARRFPATS